MYRDEKQASRVCTKRWQERAYQLHRKKLADIKPSVDNKTPQMYPHLYQKLKKAQKEEELCSEIERDNRTLVKRMTEIMKRPGIDTHNDSKSKSLNKEARQRELLRITEENQKLLKRIHSRQPTYNHLAWEQDREKSEMLCARICQYPYRPRTTAEKNLYYYESMDNQTPGYQQEQELQQQHQPPPRQQQQQQQHEQHQPPPPAPAEDTPQSTPGAAPARDPPAQKEEPASPASPSSAADESEPETPPAQAPAPAQDDGKEDKPPTPEQTPEPEPEPEQPQNDSPADTPAAAAEEEEPAAAAGGDAEDAPADETPATAEGAGEPQADGDEGKVEGDQD